MDILQQIISSITNVNNLYIGIVMHDNPDADAIGSAVALETILKQLGKEVTIISQQKINKHYSKIIGKNRINKINVSKNRFDLLFILDCSEINRASVDCQNLGKFTIVIDHHIGFTPYGDLYWCEETVATAMLIYKLLIKLVDRNNVQFTKRIATSLYMGIRSDSFNFRNQQTNYKVHLVCADLLKHEADIELINNIEKYQRSILSLEQIAWQNVIYDSKYKIIYVLITKKQIEDSNSNCTVASYLVDILKQLQDVDVAITFIESNNEVYIKARTTNPNIDIAKVMKDFGGGGHKMAAGAVRYCDSSYSLINQVISRVKDEIDYSKMHYTF